MPKTEDKANVESVVAPAQYAEKIVTEAVKSLRDRFASSPKEFDDVDRLLTAQLAATLLQLSLRPAAVRDVSEVRRLVQASGLPFRTDMSLASIAEIVAETGAILKGHFVLLSELHSNYYFMFSRLGTRVQFRKKLAEELAKRFASIGIDSVVAPMTAGGLLVQDVAAELGAGFAFLDVDDHSRPIGIRRGYAVRGATLIVNDVTTTGQGIERMLDVVAPHSKKVVGIGLIATRGASGVKIVEQLTRKGLKIEVLCHLAIDAVVQQACDKCRQGEPSVNSSDINR